jgi:tRNA pseudouridine38-40 synthase
MARYKLIIAYDGTEYAGWQEQSSRPTVAGTLRTQFERICALPCALIGASRTDAGVHAYGQIALVTIPHDFEPARLLRLWNNALPANINIRTVEYANTEFHPLCNVYRKTYQYVIFTARPLPQHAPFGLFYQHKLDTKLLQKALSLFVGTHDFSRFAALEDAVDPIRTIDQIEYTENKAENKIVITVTGKSFIRHMIRRVIGAALTVAAGHKNRTLNDIQQCLTNKNAVYCFENAAPHGLSLQSISYLTPKEHR